MSEFDNLTSTYGRATITAAGDATVIAAPGTGKTLRLGAVTITIEGAADTARVALEDGVGGDVLWAVTDGADGRIDGSYSLFFAGRRLTANTLLNLTGETANATVFVDAQAWV